MIRKKTNAADLAGARRRGDTEKHDRKSNLPIGRPEFQGNSNDRSIAQQAPIWERPNGWEALEILSHHWPEPLEEADS